jgi:hypothetical protein
VASIIGPGQSELPIIDSAGLTASPGLGAILAQITNSDTSRVFLVKAIAASSVAAEIDLIVPSQGTQKTIPLLLAANSPGEVIVLAWVPNAGIVQMKAPAAIVGNVTAALNMYLASPGTSSGWIGA